jgi:cytochrome c biogenesis protein ResB
VIGQRIIKPLGSWWITVVLMLSLVSTYISFTFADNPYSGWINFLFHTPAGLFIYLAFIANLLFASLRIVYDRLKYVPASPADIRAMDVYIEVPASDTADLEKIEGWMRRHGFTGKINDKTINARKGNFSFLPGTLMRAGLIVLMTAFLFSVYLRKTEETILHPKETHSFSGSEVSLDSIKSNLPEDFLQVGEEGTFKLEKVSAVLISSGNPETVTSGFPVKIKGQYYRISDIGFSQELLLESSGEKIEKLLDLNILPPGKTDIVDLPSSNNLFLTFTLHPEKTISKGLLTGKQYFLVKPYYHIVIQSGKEKGKKEAVAVRPGETITSGSYSVSLGKNSVFIKIKSVYDPALLWIYTGLLLGLSGIMLMLSRFFWYERQLTAVLADNTVLIGYREEFFKKWGIQKFLWWNEELSSLQESPVDKPQPAK